MRNHSWRWAAFCVLLAACTTTLKQRSAAELLAEPNYAWVTDSTAHTRVHYLPGTPAADSLTRLKRDIEAAWNRANEFVGERPNQRVIDVFTVPKREMVSQLAHLPGETNALNFWEHRVVISLITARGGPGPHEFVHIMANESWGDTKEWWLGEGVAVAAGRWNGVDVHSFAKCLSNAGKLLPLDMMVPNPRKSLNERITYPEAGSFVRFLIERYGRAKVAQLYSQGASAIPTVYGQTVTALEQEWRRYLESADVPVTACDIS